MGFHQRNLQISLAAARQRLGGSGRPCRRQHLIGGNSTGRDRFFARALACLQRRFCTVSVNRFTGTSSSHGLKPMHIPTSFMSSGLVRST